MDKKLFKQELTVRMEGALKVLDNDLKGLRTGRASVNLLDPVQVEVYGSRMPISQVASVSTEGSRTLNVQVWDKGMAKAVEKAIADSNLGLLPIADGQTIRITLPILSEERRKELVKLAYKYGENTKVAVRNIRKDGNDELKTAEKDNFIAKDEHHSLSEETQKLTNEFNDKIDAKVKQKEGEILKI